MKESALLDCLSTSYRLDLDGHAYVQELAEAAAPLFDRGLGVMAYTYATQDVGPPIIDHFATSKRFDPRWLPPFYEAVEASGLEVGSPQHPTGFGAWGHLPCGQASAIPAMRPLLPIFAHVGGARDAIGVNAYDASGRGLWLGAALPSTTKVAAARMRLFGRLAAHLTSAVRLRRNANGAKAHAVAILSPTGELLHGDNEGVIDARDELRQATVAFERAHTKRARADVEGTTRRWRPLVGARWSLLDEFDSDGRRFVVAIENGPPTRPPRRDLSEREHQVMTQAHLGHSDKVIAYELGLSASTVRVLLHRGARKLGASGRRDALARFAALAPRRGQDPP